MKNVMDEVSKYHQSVVDRVQKENAGLKGEVERCKDALR